MKKNSGRLFLASLTSALFVLAGSASPALSKCIQKHPIFGIDVYVEDKYCQKKMIKKKPAAKRTGTTSTPKRASVAAKPDARIKKMQTMLARMGYNPGPADGFNGPATKKAAGDFNIANDLPRKASVGSTMAVLGHLMGPKSSPEMKSEPAPQMAAKAPAPAVAPAPASAKISAPKPDMRVKKMQSMLASMGYNPGPANGIYGPATRKAAADFNVANGLPKKASIGSTIAVLGGLMGPKEDAAPDKTSAAPASDSSVREMQNLLAGLGYNPGPANGVEGPETVMALNKFHQSMGLPDSTSRSNTLVLLNRAAGK